MKLPFDSVIPLLGIYPKDSEIPIQKIYMHPMHIAELLTIAEIWKRLKCPSVGEWRKKLWYIYTMEYHAAVKKKKLSHFATAWMNPQKIMLSEFKPVRKRKIPCDLTYMWNIVNTINKQNSNRILDIVNTLTAVRKEVGGWDERW